MVNRTIILLAPETAVASGIAWERLGETVTELSELYRLVRERRVDLVLVDENRADLKRPVARRIRRQNGLTEIWLLTHDREPAPAEVQFIDGRLPLSLGPDGLAQKIAHIYHGKHLLERYDMVGRAPQMKIVAETIERIAPTDVSVLVVGQSGTGKELVARALHTQSARKDRPYVAINCGALAEGVLESELFGHERGAFTGSVARREGLFARAEGGTIFLDEIGETKPDTQVKLLRVLEDGTYYPVGSSTARHADVRVIAATNRDLTEAISERRFREDLYFRIGVVKIVLPPLLDRKQDIEALLQHFWRGKELDYTDPALDLLLKYDWSGNVRQLKNFADRMRALKPRGTVEVEDVERFIDEQHVTAKHLPVTTGKTVEEAGQELIYRAILQLGAEIRLLRDLITAHLPSEPPEETAEAAPAADGATMEEVEERMIRRTLRETGGNRKEAARRLGIGERTLYRKLKKYGLS
ncbi:MAG TPA: sigma-54 dependent transcriptional regulator [candidate division Zixibacteria bacterium]|nr:sigma-54-dependent Fis family transcriptional regulator [candidate division Zixibacteria bacterium]MDD4916316.1 sigma-54 dependent transcriptional regulator [candidate division Zixibacteria bacterium]MDM7971832.1 sigma-54 dependent transcriptional regulator [candidate division Zixibacteria bacterium]HOD65703.1 sigma-54 dependent transcriptional regulator [candidate division Zixibacteria bacterium]HPC10502.1 sigma-54 dependent transcriptional regulator [candidate division Zixibacteria bacteri